MYEQTKVHRTLVPSGRKPSDEIGYNGVVVGPLRAGSFLMRGRPLASHFSFGVYSSRQQQFHERHELVLAVKDEPPTAIMLPSTRLIYDVLDSGFSRGEARRIDPAKFWSIKHDRIGFDEILATSPAAAESMQRVLPRQVQVHLVPHHADHRVEPGWHDPAGPIVYAGARSFVRRRKRILDEAAQSVGRRIIWDHRRGAWKSLQGASLALCLRLPPTDTPLNRIAKPQVKLANAAQAGIPVLTTDDPCTLSLWPEVVHGSNRDFCDSKRVATLLNRALESEPPRAKFPQSEWLATMERLIE